MFKMSTNEHKHASVLAISQRPLEPRHTCIRRCRSSSMSWPCQWCHIYVTCKI